VRPLRLLEYSLCLARFFALCKTALSLEVVPTWLRLATPLELFLSALTLRFKLVRFSATVLVGPMVLPPAAARWEANLAMTFDREIRGRRPDVDLCIVVCEELRRTGLGIGILDGDEGPAMGGWLKIFPAAGLAATKGFDSVEFVIVSKGFSFLSWVDF